MSDDYFKTNPGVKDMPKPGIEPQSPSPQPVVIAMSYNDTIEGRSFVNQHREALAKQYLDRLGPKHF